jgi:hypothetical protein
VRNKIFHRFAADETNAGALGYFGFCDLFLFLVGSKEIEKIIYQNKLNSTKNVYITT